MKKLILLIILALAMVGCETHKKVIDIHDEVEKSDSTAINNQAFHLDNLLVYNLDAFDSIYNEFTRTIKIYDTKTEGSPLMAEITEESSSGKVSSTTEHREEHLVIFDTIYTQVIVHHTDSIHAYYEEQKDKESKPPSWWNWICFCLCISAFVAGGLLIRKILKL